MGLNTTFTVLHKNNEAQEQLGLGTVVGDLIRSTKVQYQDKIVKNGSTIPAMITEERTELMYQVLWENARDVSPSLHKSTDLMWVDVAGIDDGEDDEDLEEEVDEETVEFVNTAGGIDYGNDVVHTESSSTEFVGATSDTV